MPLAPGAWATRLVTPAARAAERRPAARSSGASVPGAGCSPGLSVPGAARASRPTAACTPGPSVPGADSTRLRRGRSFRPSPYVFRMFSVRMGVLGGACASPVPLHLDAHPADGKERNGAPGGTYRRLGVGDRSTTRLTCANVRPDRAPPGTFLPRRHFGAGWPLTAPQWAQPSTRRRREPAARRSWGVVRVRRSRVVRRNRRVSRIRRPSAHRTRPPPRSAEPSRVVCDESARACAPVRPQALLAHCGP